MMIMMKVMIRGMQKMKKTAENDDDDDDKIISLQ